MGQVTVESTQGIGTITLNRPEDGNAATAELLGELGQALMRSASEPDLRALIVTGAGADFCRGRIPAEASGSPTALQVQETLRAITEVNRLLREFPVPTFAAVEGRALGFGFGLAVGCDITVVSSDATLGFPELLRDLPPTIVMSYLGRLIPRKKALELVLTGRTVPPAEAETMGLVNRVAAAGDAYAQAKAMATAVAKLNPLAVRTARNFFREAQEMNEETASRYAISILATLLSSREHTH